MGKTLILADGSTISYFGFASPFYSGCTELVFGHNLSSLGAFFCLSIYCIVCVCLGGGDREREHKSFLV